MAKSNSVSNENWVKYDFVIKPKQNWQYIMFEVFYKIPTVMPYNGNILIDNLSGLTPCYPRYRILHLKTHAVSKKPF